MTTVERIPCPDRNTFEREIVPLRRPVILTGGLDTWGARSWSFSFFRQRYGNVKVAVEEGELFECSPVTSKGRLLAKVRRQITLAQFVNHMERPIEGIGRLYLAEWRILEQLPELDCDIDFNFPGLFPRELAAPTTVYMGPSGTYTPLHFDYAPNLTAQLRGHKKWVFYPPEETRRLYAYPWYSQLAHFSAADSPAKLVDFARFPMLREASGIEAIVQENDLLYVPEMWWLHVLGLSPSISLNFFWKPLPLLVWQIAARPVNRALKRTRASDVPNQFAALAFALRSRSGSGTRKG